MYDIIRFPFQVNQLSKELSIHQILAINEQSREYGLILTKSDALTLLKTRDQALNNFGRVEIGSGTIDKIIASFCDSVYLRQANYTEILNELIETFYYMKNETLDLIGDDEIIAFMKDRFETRCGGSIELLQGRELEAFARNIRFFAEPFEDNLQNSKEDHE